MTNPENTPAAPDLREIIAETNQQVRLNDICICPGDMWCRDSKTPEKPCRSLDALLAAAERGAAPASGEVEEIIERLRDFVTRKTQYSDGLFVSIHTLLLSLSSQLVAAQAKMDDAVERSGKLREELFDVRKFSDGLRSRLFAAEARVRELEKALQRIADGADCPDNDATGDRQKGLFCGVEDSGRTDRYDGALYGYAEGIDRAMEWARNEACAALSGTHAPAPSAQVMPECENQLMDRICALYIDRDGFDSIANLISKVEAHYAQSGKEAKP